MAKDNFFIEESEDFFINEDKPKPAPRMRGQEAFVGGVEVATSMITGLAGALEGTLRGVDNALMNWDIDEFSPEVMRRIEQRTYKPRTTSGKEIESIISGGIQQLDKLTDEHLVEPNLEKGNVNTAVMGAVSAKALELLAPVRLLGGGKAPKPAPEFKASGRVFEGEAVKPVDNTRLLERDGWAPEQASTVPENPLRYTERVYPPVEITTTPLHTTPAPKPIPFVVYPEFTPGVDAWSKNITSSDGTIVGKSDGLIDKNKLELTFRNQFVNPEARGHGSGLAAFKDVVDYALDNKLTVRSDASVTVPAAALYEKLADSGMYIVEKNPDAILDKTADGVPRWVSESSGVPVFRIHERKLRGDEVSKPVIDYGKMQDKAKAEDLTRTITKNINKDVPRNPSQFVVDERPLYEVKPDLYTVATDKSIKFGTGATEQLTRTYTPKALDLPARYGAGGRLIPGRGQYISGTFVGVIKHNPIVNWVSSQGRREMQWVRQQFEEAMFGADIKMRFGKPMYIPTERGWSTKYNALPLEQRGLVMDAKIKYDDPSRLEPVSPEVLAKEGLTPEAIDFFYFDSVTISKPVLGVNSVISELKKAGYSMEEFTMYEGYSPRIWTGDFRTFVKDKAGNVLITVPSNTIVTSKLIERKLKKEYGDKYVISSYARKDKTNDSSIEAINDLIAKAETKFPEQAAEIAEFLQSQKDIKGMGVHGIARKGARGFLGDSIMEPSLAKRSEDFQKSRELFIHGMLRKESSLRLRFNMDELRQDPVLRSLYPNSIKYSERMVDDYLGRRTLGDELIAKYTTDLLGQSGIKTVVEKGSSLMTYPILLMGSVPNMAVQPLQTGYSVIKAIAMRNSLGLSSADVMAAAGRGIMDMGGGKSPEILDVALEAGKRGAVAPEFIQMMHESEALQGRPLKHSAWYKDLATGKLLYSTPDEYSRLAQVFVFYRTLKAGGKSHETAKLDAIELSKQYSVPYNNMERPAAYRGTTGALLGKFQTWSSNQYAQMLEHIDAAKHGDFKPLGAYLAYSALVAGLYGFWGIEESDFLVEQVNKKFQTTYKLPSMHIAEHAPDWLAYGPAQTALGYTTGTAELPAFNRRLTSLAMIDFYTEITASTTNLISKSMGFGSPPTKMDLERAMIALAPRSMHSVIKTSIERGEIGSIPEGESVLIHDPKTGKGLYRQDRQSQIINDLGGKTVAQHKMSLINRWVQGLEESRSLTMKDWAAYVAISSSMGMPVNLEKFADGIAEQYQITPKEFMGAVQSQATKFNTDIKERVFDVKSAKGQRAGSKFVEQIEQGEQEEFFIK